MVPSATLGYKSVISWEISLTINSYNFDIITLSETWLKDNPLLLQHVSVPKYQLCYNNRNVCKGGGVDAYIKDSIVLAAKILETYSLNLNTYGLKFLVKTKTANSY